MLSPNCRIARFIGLPLLAVVLYVLPASDANAQRAGDSAYIRAGIVVGHRTVDLRSGNTARGAVVGGALGAALTRNSSSRKRNQTAALGAIIGSSAERNRRKSGREYTVEFPDGGLIRVATEQKSIAIGDCVFIEERNKGTNIRRAPDTACEPESEDVMQDADVVADMQRDAASCFAAREELANAEEDAVFERAVRKVQILCYD